MSAHLHNRLQILPSIVLTLLVSLLPVQGYAAKSEQQAPNFSIKHLLDGKQVSLNQYKGKVVYVDFWASWCPPCLKSFPFMEDLQTQHGKQGLVVLAVNLDENTDDAKVFLKETMASFFVGFNKKADIATLYLEASWNQELPQSWLLTPGLCYYSQEKAFFYEPFSPRHVMMVFIPVITWS